MPRIVLAALLSLMSLPVTAGVPPMTFPDLTFPAPPTQPDVSTQGCAIKQTPPCT